jgi:hypothetical protein
LKEVPARAMTHNTTKVDLILGLCGSEFPYNAIGDSICSLTIIYLPIKSDGEFLFVLSAVEGDSLDIAKQVRVAV